MIVASLALLVLSQSKAPPETFRVWKGISGPRVPVRYSRPTLRWNVWPDDPARKVVGASLSLNGLLVPVVYDPQLRAVTYTPPNPLKEGTYKIECRVLFDNGRIVDEKWDTTVLAAALAELPPPTQAQKEALAAINRLRERMGQPAVVSDDRMNFAATLHSKYLSEHKATGHHQDPTKAGYLGATGAMRLEAYGYVGASWEGVDFGSRNPTEAVRSLFDAPLHRLPFLQPGKFAVGNGFVGQHFTLEFGEGDSEGTVISPSNGESEVPIQWRNYETPNPLQAFPYAPKLVGYPIVLARFGRNPALGTVSAKLFGPSGEEVRCYFVPPTSSRAFAALLIPHFPLERDANYAVHFTETLKGKEREFRAVFRTART
jgi:hypothetical protein